MHVVSRGSGTPLVLLHGFGVDHRILAPLDPVVAALGGWRRIYVDLPGMGRSPGDGVASSEDVVAAVEATIRAEVGSEPFAVLGNSYGAMIARRVTRDLGDQVLGLATVAGVCGPAGGVRDLPPRTVLADAAARDDPWWTDVWLGTGDDGADDPALAGYREMAVVPSAAALDLYRRWVHPGVEAADQAVLARIRECYSLDAEPEQTASAPFARPALFLTGRQDQMVGFADAWRLLEHYPRGTFVVLDAAGHNVHLDQPEQTAAALTAWLGRLRG